MWKVKRSYCLLLTSSATLSLLHQSYFYATQITASLTPYLPPLPSPHHLYLSPPLSNCLHTVQGAHGLDGKPGPVVSGTRPVPLTLLLSSPFISLYLFASTACLHLAMCLSTYVSICLPLPLCLF